MNIPSHQVNLDSISIGAPSSTSQTIKLDDDETNEFALHRMLVQEVVLRLSWSQKLEFLIRLLKEITSLESIYLLMASLKPLMDGKSWLYSEIAATTNYVHDKMLLDHSRSLDPTTFAEHEGDEAAWFSKLSHPQQLSVITNLLRISGGSVTRQIYRRLLDILQERVKAAHAKQSAPVSASYVKPQFSGEMKDTSETYQKLQEARKEWKDKIEKYRKEVEGKSKAGKTMSRGSDDKRSKKSEKSSEGKAKKGDHRAAVSKSKYDEATKKPSKHKQIAKKSHEMSSNTRSATRSRSSSKTKTKKKGENESDYLQRMPIWTNMKIFNYLDDKTLRKIKDVNSYWSYVSDLVEEERKARKAANKVIKKMETEFNSTSKIENQSKEDIQEYYKLTALDKKMYKMSWIGACDKRIFGKTNLKNTDEGALIMDALTMTREQYVLPVHYLTTYPRLKKNDLPPIYQLPFCCLRDINFAFENPEDMVTETYHLKKRSTASSPETDQASIHVGCYLSEENSTSRSSFPYWDHADLSSW